MQAMLLLQSHQTQTASLHQTSPKPAAVVVGVVGVIGVVAVAVTAAELGAGHDQTAALAIVLQSHEHLETTPTAVQGQGAPAAAPAPALDDAAAAARCGVAVDEAWVAWGLTGTCHGCLLHLPSQTTAHSVGGAAAAVVAAAVAGQSNGAAAGAAVGGRPTCGLEQCLQEDVQTNKTQTRGDTTCGARG